MAQKHLDEKSIVGVAFMHSKWEGIDIWGVYDPDYNDYWSTSNYTLVPTIGYYLLPENRRHLLGWFGSNTIFNPIAVLGAGVGFIKMENQTRKLSDEISDMKFAIMLVNRVKVSKKVGFTFGITLMNNKQWEFDENGELYVYKTSVFSTPLLTIDITMPPFSKKKD